MSAKWGGGQNPCPHRKFEFLVEGENNASNFMRKIIIVVYKKKETYIFGYYVH